MSQSNGVPGAPYTCIPAIGSPNTIQNDDLLKQACQKNNLT